MKIDKSKSPDRNRPWKDYGFDETKIDLTAGGKSDQLTLCPECSANRSKRKKHKCCSINVDYGVWHCHHCNASGYVPTRRELDARNQVLAVTREAVVRRGIRILVLAPLNSIMRDDEDKGQHHTLLRYGQRSLRAMRDTPSDTQRSERTRPERSAERFGANRHGQRHLPQNRRLALVRQALDRLQQARIRRRVDQAGATDR